MNFNPEVDLYESDDVLFRRSKKIKEVLRTYTRGGQTRFIEAYWPTAVGLLEEINGDKAESVAAGLGISRTSARNKLDLYGPNAAGIWFRAYEKRFIIATLCQILPKGVEVEKMF